MNQLIEYIIEICLYLYCIVVIINLTVFVQDSLKLSIDMNTVMIKALLNPLSMLNISKTKISIMSGELRYVENKLYRKRSVLLEKKSNYIILKKCFQCGEAPRLGVQEWTENVICVHCKCGKYFLEGINGLRFKWPFPIMKLYSENDDSKLLIESITQRGIKAIIFSWSNLPDMHKRDETIVLMKEVGLVPPVFKR